MKPYSFLFISSLATLILSGPLKSEAQTEIQPYQPGITQEGITYFLPQTRLHIVVRAQRESYIPGEYAAFAQRFLDAPNVEQQPFDTWMLQQIEVVPYGVADRTQAYTIKLNHKTSAPLVELAPDGRLLSVNTTADALPTLETPSVKKISKVPPQGNQYKTQEILRAGSTVARAEITAQEIYDIRENRGLLAKGQADFNPKDGEQLKTMMAQLDERENALLSLFLGTKSTEEHVFTFEVTPQQMQQTLDLFRFSRYLGLVDVNDVSGTPIRLQISDQATLPEAEESPKKKKEVKDLRYRIPSNAAIRIFDESRVWFDGIIPIAQFGRIEHLGGVLFNKKFNTKVRLSPITGRVEKLDLEQFSK